MGINVRVEEDENIRDAFNEFTDDGKKQETLDDQAATIVDALRQGSYRTP
jgi:uncharacterized protein YheU (UPF0270 family)